MSLLSDDQINEILDKYEDISNYSLYHQLCLQPLNIQAQFWKGKSDEEIEALMYDLKFVGNIHQQAPPEDQHATLYNYGRGAGKSWLGGAMVVKWALSAPNTMITIIGNSEEDLKKTMCPAILERTPPSIRANVNFNRSDYTIVFPNGSTVYSYKANKPEALRGPSCSYVWVDECGKFSYLDQVQMQIASILRTNQFIDKSKKQVIYTSTPVASKQMLALRDDPNITVVTSTTFQNGATSRLDKFLALRKLGMTKQSRVEFFAEWITDITGALWKQSDIDETRVDRLPCKLSELEDCIVSIDPNGGTGKQKKKGDHTGLVVVGRYQDHCYVLEDASMLGSQKEWATQAIRLFWKWNCSKIVYEQNGVGMATGTILDMIDDTVPHKAVNASESKMMRAEIPANLYQHHRVHHVGSKFIELEDQMTSWVPNKGASPDRVDSLVWGITTIMNLKKAEAFSFVA